MVGLQVLVLAILVRIQVPEQDKSSNISAFFCFKLMKFEREVEEICQKALETLGFKDLVFKILRSQQSIVNTKRNFVIGRTNLRTGLIEIDIWTPKKRRPKKISSILRTLCHEVAHHQKKPYRQRFRGRIITRMHFPIFYRQVNKNIARLKKIGLY